MIWGEDIPQGRIVYALERHNSIPEGATSEIRIEQFRPYAIVRSVSPFGTFNFHINDKPQVVEALRQLAEFIEKEGK